MMPVTPSVPNLFSKESKTGKDAFTVKSHFDFRLRLHFCFSDLSFQKVEKQSHDFRFQVRFQISDSRKRQGREIKIGISISDFRFQTRARERNRNRDFDFRFQISDSRKGVKLKWRFRFQISDFRLAQGREIVNVSFISISGFDCRVASEED